MKERPILFSGPMVRALLAGQKTQTRRLVKGPVVESLNHPEVNPRQLLDACPYGKPCDQLWVRETWCNTLERGGLLNQSLKAKVGSVEFAADMDIERFPLGGNFTPRMRDFKWTPSIHMPRWASRITLDITGVRVERLNDISETDARAEGCSADEDPYWRPTYNNPDSGGNPSCRLSFEYLWSTIHAADGPNGWAANPWVWVVEFKRVTE